MAQKTAVDKLNEALNKILEQYSDDLSENVAEIAQAMGQKGVAALKQKSAETFPLKRGARVVVGYSKGWKMETETKRTGTTVTIYNAHPGLPHLLENGHVTRNGTGRTFPRTPAHVHIQPVADELIKTFEQEVLGKL